METFHKQRILGLIKCSVYFGDISKEDVMRAIDKALADIEKDEKLINQYEGKFK